jgi:hypothetical protein
LGESIQYFTTYQTSEYNSILSIIKKRPKYLRNIVRDDGNGDIGQFNKANPHSCSLLAKLNDGRDQRADQSGLSDAIQKLF